MRVQGTNEAEGTPSMPLFAVVFRSHNDGKQVIDRKASEAKRLVRSPRPFLAAAVHYQTHPRRILQPTRGHPSTHACLTSPRLTSKDTFPTENPGAVLVRPLPGNSGSSAPAAPEDSSGSKRPPLSSPRDCHPGMSDSAESAAPAMCRVFSARSRERATVAPRQEMMGAVVARSSPVSS